MPAKSKIEDEMPVLVKAKRDGRFGAPTSVEEMIDTIFVLTGHQAPGVQASTYTAMLEADRAGPEAMGALLAASNSSNAAGGSAPITMSPSQFRHRNCRRVEWGEKKEKKDREKSLERENRDSELNLNTSGSPAEGPDALALAAISPPGSPLSGTIDGLNNTLMLPPELLNPEPPITSSFRFLEQLSDPLLRSTLFATSVEVGWNERAFCKALHKLWYTLKVRSAADLRKCLAEALSEGCDKNGEFGKEGDGSEAEEGRSPRSGGGRSPPRSARSGGGETGSSPRGNGSSASGGGGAPASDVHLGIHGRGEIAGFTGNRVNGLLWQAGKKQIKKSTWETMEKHLRKGGGTDEKKGGGNSKGDRNFGRPEGDSGSDLKGPSEESKPGSSSTGGDSGDSPSKQAAETTDGNDNESTEGGGSKSSKDKDRSSWLGSAKPVVQKRSDLEKALERNMRYMPLRPNPPKECPAYGSGKEGGQMVRDLRVVAESTVVSDRRKKMVENVAKALEVAHEQGQGVVNEIKSVA